MDQRSGFRRPQQVSAVSESERPAYQRRYAGAGLAPHRTRSSRCPPTPSGYFSGCWTASAILRWICPGTRPSLPKSRMPRAGILRTAARREKRCPGPTRGCCLRPVPNWTGTCATASARCAAMPPTRGAAGRCASVPAATPATSPAPIRLSSRWWWMWSATGACWGSLAGAWRGCGRTRHWPALWIRASASRKRWRGK